MRTPKEVKAEIAKLKKMKPTVRRTSMFGDNHHDAIEAQIEVLTDNLDTDAIWALQDDGDWTEGVREQAERARDWMDGDEPMAPSEEWKELVIK